MKLGKVFITLLGITSAGLISWVFISFMSSEDIKPTRTAQIESSAFVKTEKVQNSTVQITIKAEGRVHNASLVNLISEVKGDIVRGRHPLKEGETFKRGELIFYASNPEAQFALKALRSGYIQLITSIMADIKVDFPDGYNKWDDFYSNLNEEKDLPALPEVSSSREKMFLSNRQVYKAYYEIKSKEAQYRKHYFYAPFDGVLMNVSLQEGTQLNPGMAVGVFGKNSEKEIEISLSRLQSEQIKPGAKAIIKNQNGATITNGTVVRLSDFLNPATQSFTCYVRVKKEKEMKDGEYYSVEIEGGEVKNAFEVSANSIYGENSLYLLNNDGTLTKEHIELRYYDDEIAIVKGLKINDIVVNQKVNAIENRKYKAIK